jgi:hypothetical protein
MKLTIIVIESGFVYVGFPSVSNHEILGKVCILRDAKKIRVYGTTKGLGQLANIGTTKDTILDFDGVVTIPIIKILHFIEVQEEAARTF